MHIIFAEGFVVHDLIKFLRFFYNVEIVHIRIQQFAKPHEADNAVWSGWAIKPVVWKIRYFIIFAVSYTHLTLPTNREV